MTTMDMQPLKESAGAGGFSGFQAGLFQSLLVI